MKDRTTPASDLRGQSSPLYWTKVRGKPVAMGYTHYAIYKGYAPLELRRMVGTSKLRFYRYDASGRKVAV